MFENRANAMQELPRERKQVNKEQERGEEERCADKNLNKGQGQEIVTNTCPVKDLAEN